MEAKGAAETSGPRKEHLLCAYYALRNWLPQSPDMALPEGCNSVLVTREAQRDEIICPGS